MGLDITVGDYGFRAGSYSGFAEFRAVLAKHALNITLNSMIGFGEKGGNSWETINSGLKVLLDHSDCDGEIYPNQAMDLLNALKAYKAESGRKKAMKKEDDNDWYWEKIDEWISACKASIDQNCPIIFG